MSVHAVVMRKRKRRKGKGFSRSELKEKGLSLNQALKLRVPIDTRRRSKHEENIKSLKEHLERDLKKT